jgi:hypothetical protein
MRGDLPQGDDQPDLEGSKPPDPAPSSGPSARSLLIAAILMVAVGYFLTVKLREMSRMQDCLMSGRTNCAPIAGANP